MPKGMTEAEERRLYVYSGGFLTQPRIRRILTLAGYTVRIGAPQGPEDRVGVWGHSPTAPRGEKVSVGVDTSGGISATPDLVAGDTV